MDEPVFTPEQEERVRELIDEYNEPDPDEIATAQKHLDEFRETLRREMRERLDRSYAEAAAHAEQVKQFQDSLFMPSDPRFIIALGVLETSEQFTDYQARAIARAIVAALTFAPSAENVSSP
jgi:hypothetical protein